MVPPARAKSASIIGCFDPRGRPMEAQATPVDLPAGSPVKTGYLQEGATSPTLADGLAETGARHPWGEVSLIHDLPRPLARRLYLPPAMGGAPRVDGPRRRLFPQCGSSDEPSATAPRRSGNRSTGRSGWGARTDQI